MPKPTKAVEADLLRVRVARLEAVIKSFAGLVQQDAHTWEIVRDSERFQGPGDGMRIIADSSAGHLRKLTAEYLERGEVKADW